MKKFLLLIPLIIASIFLIAPSTITTPAPTYKVIYGSQAGVFQDYVVGGKDANKHDDTRAIQTALNKLAAAGGGLYVQDKGYSMVTTNSSTPTNAVSCLLWPSNVKILCLPGTGFYVKSNTYMGFIATQMTNTLATTNIEWEGGEIYFNGLSGLNANTSFTYYTVRAHTNNTDQPYTQCIWLCGVRNAKITGLKVHNVIVSSIQLQHCMDVTIKDCMADGTMPVGPAFQSAFVTLWGNQQNIVLDGSKLNNTGDDSFAFNFNELPMAFNGRTNHIAGRNGTTTWGTNSFMTNVMVLNTSMRGVRNGFRFAAYGVGTSNNYATQILIDNLNGDTFFHQFWASESVNIRVGQLAVNNLNLTFDVDPQTGSGMFGALPIENLQVHNVNSRWMGFNPGMPMFTINSVTNMVMSDIITRWLDEDTSTNAGPSGPGVGEAITVSFGSTSKMRARISDILQISGDQVLEYAGASGLTISTNGIVRVNP